MRLLFKQRFFSWFDSYDIYDEHKNTVFTVRGKLSWGHKLEIYDALGNHIATLKERMLTFLPKFELHIGGNYVGEIQKELTFLKPSFKVNLNGWSVKGDYWEWDYNILSGSRIVATIQKQIFNWTDAYIIDVANENDNLLALMVVLAIDAVKCSQNN